MALFFGVWRPVLARTCSCVLLALVLAWPAAGWSGDMARNEGVMQDVAPQWREHRFDTEGGEAIVLHYRAGLSQRADRKRFPWIGELEWREPKAPEAGIRTAQEDFGRRVQDALESGGKGVLLATMDVAGAEGGSSRTWIFAVRHFPDLARAMTAHLPPRGEHGAVDLRRYKDPQWQRVLAWLPEGMDPAADP